MEPDSIGEFRNRAVSQLQGLGLIKSGNVAHEAWVKAIKNLTMEQLVRGVRYAAESYESPGTIKPAQFINWCKRPGELTGNQRGESRLSNAGWRVFKDAKGRDFGHHPDIPGSVPPLGAIEKHTAYVPHAKLGKSIQAVKADIQTYIEKTQPPEVTPFPYETYKPGLKQGRAE